MKLVLLIMFVFSALANTVTAGELSDYKPLEHASMGMRDIPSRESLIIFGAASVATVASYYWLDEPVKEFFIEKPRLGEASKVGNFLGNGLPTTLLGFGLLGYGALTNIDRELNAGLAFLEASFFDFIFTHALKYTIRRERPDLSSRTSFPSGHASRSFAAVGSLLSFYGWKAGAPALAAAVFISTCRMASNKHYLSDSIFGAAMGFITARAFAKHHLTPEVTASISIQGGAYIKASLAF